MFRGISSSSLSAGNIFARSGQAQGGAVASQDDTHIYMQNCTGVVVVANSSRTGPNDVGGGYNSPFYAVYDGAGNVGCIIGQNALAYHNNSSGTTTGPINVVTTFSLAAGLNQTFWS